MSCDPGSSFGTITERLGGSHTDARPKPSAGKMGDLSRHLGSARQQRNPDSSRHLVTHLRGPPQRDGLRWAPWESPLPRDSQDGGREKNATLLVSSPPPCLIAEKGKMLERTKDERRDEQKAWRAPPQTAEEKLSRSAPTKEPCSSAPVLPVCSAECVRRRRAECCSLPVLRLRARFGRETSAGDRKRL